MSAATSSRNLGGFSRGERPDALLVTFQDNAGDAINISGRTITVVWSNRSLTTINTFSGTVSDGSAGVASVPWGTTTHDPHPFDIPGTIEIEVWAAAASPPPKHVSEKFYFTVRETVAGEDNTP